MRCTDAGGTVALMGTYSAEQRELLKELKRLGRPVAGASPPGTKPPVWHAEYAEADKQIREVLQDLYGMSDAEIDYAIESLNDYDDNDT